ncbi:MAG: L,D-transpeptidase [Gammaproteobacteria bacterium]|jgi:lipoprotein-anchoring transpeptidase ErfK/SrfK|nr:L,D-transpeptidase [Gammaproteobacteria bacterium]
MKNDLLQIIIDIPSQQLHYLRRDKLLKVYPVSTGKNGVGEKNGSGQTPRGWHIIRAKIGQDQPVNTIFVGRRPIEEIYSEGLEEKYPQRDWILTRILWLSGLELGKNRLGDCDTMRRYIYIHGCPDSKPMGIPLSAGCIRMRNLDIVELFNNIPVGTKVLIRG